jgi:hypothetical protein
MCQAGTDEPGKIQKALWIIGEWPEEIEADLQRYYGVNFADLFRCHSGLTWRRFLVLFEQLPPESATRTAIRNSIPADQLAERRGDSTKASWSSTDMLLALLVDEVRNLQWMYASSHSKGNITRPEPIPRPGTSAMRGRKKISLDNIRAIDERLRGLSDEETIRRYKEMTGRG